MTNGITEQGQVVRRSANFQSFCVSYPCSARIDRGLSRGAFRIGTMAATMVNLHRNDLAPRWL